MIWYSRDENGVETPLTVSGGQTIQVNEMPAASVGYVGIVCQYIGATTANYTHNYFYECVEDTSTNPATYSWVQANVQSSGEAQVQSDWGQTNTEAVDYIKNKPTLGTASTKDVATSGDASTTQVVMGNDSRLNNSISSTSSTSPLTDSADGYVQGVTVKGHSEVVDGAIKSVGDAGFVIETSGKNIFNPNNVIDAYISGEDVITIASGFTSKTIFAKCKPNTTYTVSKIAGQRFSAGTTDSVPTLRTEVKQKIADSTAATITITTSTTAKYIAAYVYNSNNDTITAEQMLASCQIEEGSSASTYEPYKPITAATITTGLPLRSVSDTIYDTLDNDKVTKKCAEVDLGTLTWYTDNEIGAFYCQPTSKYVPTTMEERGNILCSNYVSYGGSTQYMPDKSAMSLYEYVYIKDSSYNDATAFKSAMNGVKLMYELATPTETPLTSAEKSALASLRTYDHTTHIDATDEPTMTVDYLLNTNNGQAVANLDNKIKSGFDELKKESEHFVYAFYIDHNDTNPATCVHPYISKYGCDNYFYIPAKMNYTTGTFDYGSWRDFVYRIAKPCMVAYNGHVDYYLDPDDYSSKIDGYGVSNIDDMSYAGNVMVELDCLYFKRWKANNKSYVVISDQKLDKSFKAYAHHDKNGKVLEHIYLGAYNGSYDGTRLRSISDIECHNLNALTTNKIMSNTTRQQEMDFAMANNVQGEAGEGWFIRHKADWDYINTLLILIGMNTNTQATFGNGNISSYVSTSNTGILTTGTMNDKGLFYGKNDNVSGVKVFGIENWWGNMWVSIAGWNLVNGVQKIKMSYDQSDVSSVDGFNVTDGTGFATVSNSTPSGTNGGYISDWTIGDFGLIPTVASDASDKRLCDGLWFNNSANCFAFCGGCSAVGVHCGAFCAHLNDSASDAHWLFGAALSYKPLSA